MARAKKASKKRGAKFIQDATARMAKRGTIGSYGHHTVKQMLRDKARGGKIGKKANFALNMERIAQKRKKKRRSTKRG